MSDYGVVTEAGSIRFERLLPGPIERVWSYLTESEKRGTWLAGGRMEQRAGGSLELVFRNGDLSPNETPPEKYKRFAGPITINGQVTRCEPPRLLSYTWGGEKSESEVTFELTPRGKDVLLVLTHRRLADRTAMLSVSGGWHVHLGILADRLNGAEPRPLWATLSQVAAEYEKRLPQA